MIHTVKYASFLQQRLRDTPRALHTPKAVLGVCAGSYYVMQAHLTFHVATATSGATLWASIKLEEAIHLCRQAFHAAGSKSWLVPAC